MLSEQTAKRRSRAAKRVELVGIGLKQGKSRRQMARELACDDKTIGRDIEKLCLPADQQAAIREGDSAEQYLREARFKKTGKDELAKRRNKKSIAKDAKTGQISDDLAQVVLHWLANKEILDSANEVKLIHAVSGKKQPDRRGDRSSDPARDFAICERCEVPLDLPERISHYEQVLIQALYLIEPVQAIREAALKKVLQTLRSREPRPAVPRRWKKELDRIKRRRTHD